MVVGPRLPANIQGVKLINKTLMKITTKLKESIVTYQIYAPQHCNTQGETIKFLNT